MENITKYKIEDKEYTVITRCIEKAEDIDKLYDIVCKYIVSQKS